MARGLQRFDSWYDSIVSRQIIEGDTSMPWKRSGFLIHNSLCLKAGSQIREYANNFIGLYSKSEKRFSVIRTTRSSKFDERKIPFLRILLHRAQEATISIDACSSIRSRYSSHWSSSSALDNDEVFPKLSSEREKHWQWNSVEWCDVAEAAILNLNSNTKTTLAKVAVLVCTP